ncbi:MAG: hypothetical protein ACPL1F_00075 [bacterium]
MKKFLESFREFQEELTFEKFKTLYKKITGKFYYQEFAPEDSVLIHYYNFIKSLKPNYKKNILSYVLAPRNCYKTNTFTKVFPLMLIENSLKVKDGLTTIVIGSYTIERVEEAIFSQIRKGFERLQDITILKNNKKELVISYEGKEISIKVIHSQESLRSYNHLGKRPQLVILDDIDVPNALGVIQERIYTLNRFKDDWMLALEDGDALVLVVGNLEHEISILKYLKDNFEGLILPYKVDGKYVREIWNEEWEIEERNFLDKKSFDRFYLHKLPSSNIDFLFKDNPVGTRLIILDIGLSKYANSMAFVCFIGNTVYDVWKGTINEFLDEGINKIIEFKPHLLRYEANGYQGFIFEQIRKMIPNIEVEGFYTTTDKTVRMALAVMKLKNKEITVNPELEEELREEIGIFEKDGNSHILDCIGTFILEYLNEEPYIAF